MPRLAQQQQIKVDGLAEMDEDATIRCAVQCLQAVTDFRGNEASVNKRTRCHHIYGVRAVSNGNEQKQNVTHSGRVEGTALGQKKKKYSTRAAHRIHPPACTYICDA